MHFWQIFSPINQFIITLTPNIPYTIKTKFISAFSERIFGDIDTHTYMEVPVIIAPSIISIVFNTKNKMLLVLK